MRNALLVVDVQADFVQGGSLPVPNGMPVAAMIARHIRHFKTEYQFVVASRDYHEDPSDHFSNTPDFLVTWPPHCVIGTPGAGGTEGGRLPGPGRHSTLRYEGNPGWFSLIARAALPHALLPFRYTELDFSRVFSWPRLGVNENKVAAGHSPAALRR